MAFMKKDMEPVLQKYAGFGYTIYFLYQEGTVSLEDVQNIFLKLNPEIAFLYLEKVLHKIDEEDLSRSFAALSQAYTKEECLEDYSQFADTKLTLKQDVYETALNYHYTKEMLQELRQPSLSVADQKIIEQYQTILDQLINVAKQSVVQVKSRVR